jgi:hypothetical protein
MLSIQYIPHDDDKRREEYVKISLINRIEVIKSANFHQNGSIISASKYRHTKFQKQNIYCLSFITIAICFDEIDDHHPI